MEPKRIASELEMFIRDFPAAFPVECSWSDSPTAFFYYIGKEAGFDIRCGDWAKRWKERVWKDQSQIIPERYRPHLEGRWPVKGLLAIDLCWVTAGFDNDNPPPDERKIILAFEHEDETYNNSGTNLTAVLDEIRKIVNVKTIYKVLSFFTSKSESENGSNLPKIKAEIRRCPSREALTDTWIILQLCRYETPKTKFREIKINSTPCLYICCVGLSGNGATEQLIGEATVPLPGR